MLLPLPFTLLSAAFHAASVGVSQEEMCRQFYDGNALRTIVLRPAGIMDAPHMIDRYAPPELKVWLHQLIQNNSGGVFSFEFRGGSDGGSNSSSSSSFKQQRQQRRGQELAVCAAVNENAGNKLILVQQITWMVPPGDAGCGHRSARSGAARQSAGTTSARPPPPRSGLAQRTSRSSTVSSCPLLCGASGVLSCWPEV